MNRLFKFTDGTTVPQDACITPDHKVDTFTIEIRSLDGTTRERVRELLQTRLEVTRIVHDQQIVYARSSEGI